VKLSNTKYSKEIAEILQNLSDFQLDVDMDVLAVKAEKVYEYGIVYRVFPKYLNVEIDLYKYAFEEKTEYHAEIRRLVVVEC